MLIFTIIKAIAAKIYSCNYLIENLQEDLCKGANIYAYRSCYLKDLAHRRGVKFLAFNFE